jgi:hypothetical protein
LNADGSVDATFNPGADDVVSCLVVQTDVELANHPYQGALAIGS